ncbi:SWIM zinc finger family protein [Virgisporangium ochraceum]|uniref:SWIM-type domain-containing protein n=1 Tax=Virgisporangium ochraceum TaxID=65505 RepID=A0A8J4EG06_9ACTN|nr:SWIM zinc finger family protein [Virgisporangium ochraceum]GIJ70647.1 hypothetical protein Voc01_055640 [Virgisporangium ochraceum]
MTPAEFGATPWGRAWVRTVEPTTGPPNTLLPRARSLARNHAVTLSVTAGRVDATVAVTGTTHRAHLHVPLWTEQTVEAALRLVAGHGDAVAGDLPDAVEAEFRRHGIAVAVRPDECTSGCDCRTRRRPCVHVLATVYALAQCVDERPAVLLDLFTSGAATPARSTDWIALTDLDAAHFYGT